MDKKEARNILGVSESATLEEIKKAYRKLSLKWHPDKPTPAGYTKEQQKEKFQEINEAHEILTNQTDESDNSEIDEDAIWLMKQKIQNALESNKVKMEEMDEETVKNYEEKLRKCKTRADLESFTNEVVFFIRLYARARDNGYFGNTSGNQGTPPPQTWAG